MEFIFGLLLIAGIFKLLGWIFSPLLDKIGHTVYLLRQNEFEEARKKDQQLAMDAMQSEINALRIQRLFNEQQKSKALKEEQEKIKIVDEAKPINETMNPINTQEDTLKPKPSKEFRDTKAHEEPIKQAETDPLKAKGDKYERYIGKRFEDKGDLVIYNGFIRGFEDGGVDIATVSTDAKTINLIQCKHWGLRILELDHIEKIYEKLNTHNLDFLRLNANQIAEQLSAKKQNSEIEELLTKARKNKKNLQIRKTLYISSDKVVDMEIGKHLTMIQPNIFRYQDMKIVVEKI